MRAAFLGTPEEAVPILTAVGEVAEVSVVITRPDRTRGRSGRPLPPPVKVAAEERGWRVEQPGAAIHHRPGERHAMRAGAEPLLALYCWQGEIGKAAHLSPERA